jgi:WD40 repeat protein/esterase/lipase superfamily enzyme
MGNSAMNIARVAFSLILLASASVARAADNAPQLMLDTGGHMALIRVLAFTPDDNQLVSAGDDKVIRVWDWRAGRTVRTIRGQVGPGNEGKIFAMALSPDGRWLAAGGWTDLTTASPPCCGDIRLYDFESGKLTAILRGHTNIVNSLVFSPDSKRLISGGGGRDHRAILWDVESRTLVHQLKGHKEGINTVSFTPDGERVVTGSADTTLRLWRVSDAELIAEMTGHKEPVRSLTVSSSDGTIASGDHNGEILLSDGKTGRYLRTLGKQDTWVGVLRFSPDGTKLVSTCSGGGRACSQEPQIVWDVQTGRRLHALVRHDNIVISAAVTSSGRFSATGGSSGDIKVWDLATGETTSVLAGTGAQSFAVAFSDDGQRIAWGTTSKYRHHYDRGPLELQLRLPGGNQGLARPEPIDTASAKDFTRAPATFKTYALAHRPLGAYASGILDVTKDGRTLVSIERNSGSGFEHRAYFFTPDGSTIISAGNNGMLSAYDLTGKRLGNFVGHEGDVWAIASSPDGRLLVSGSGDQTVRLWNQKTRELIVTLFRDSDGEWVMWSPQGYYTSSPNGDRIVGWQINKGTDQAAEYVTASQLRGHFYRPDIVERAIILASATAAAGEARGTEFSLIELLKRKPPAFEIVSPTNRSRAGATPAGIRLKLEPNADPVETIEVLVNGRQATTPELRNATARSAATATLERDIAVPLEQGENKIRVVAHNKVGQTAREFVLFHDRPGLLDRRGILYVLAIGVDKYPHLPPICGLERNQTCDLQFAGKDARAFRDAIVQQASPFYRGVETRLLAPGGDKAPTKANIEMALGELFVKAGPQDTAVLFIAGHGALDGKGAGYLFMPEDAEQSSDGWNASTVVPWTGFQNALRKTQGRRLMFADTCHSGGVYNSRLVNDAADADIVVFSATDLQTVSWELPRLAHGAFTYALIRGLEGKAQMQDGTVTLLGLGAFVSREVANLTGDKQQPTYHFAGAKDSILAGTREAAERQMAARQVAEQLATARQMPGPAQGVDDEKRLVDMLFATSRKTEVSPLGRPTFTRERAEELSFGSLRVSIPPPDVHKIGRIELPTTRYFISYKYEQAADPNKHFVLSDITLLDRASFIQQAKSSGRDGALVFVHGFNNTFEEAAFRLAQMAFDMNYKGLPVLFSWAAASGVSGYRHDIDSARLARDLFVDFLQILQEKAEIKTVHVIAHSMGNALVMEALDRVAGEKLPLNIAELVMAAPDVSRDLFKQLVARVNVNKVAKGMTLYASSKDKALVASKSLALDVARAGDVPAGGPIVLPMLDTIDVSAFGEEFLGLNHNTWASNRSLIDDIGRLVNSSQRPPGVRTPQLKGQPAATNPPQYWLYPE